MIDPLVDTKVTNHPFASDASGVVNQPNVKAPAGGSVGPIPAEVREQALRQVEQDLINAGLFTKAGGIVSPQLQDEFCFERQFSLPTPGIIIKGCLDGCNVCDLGSQREMELELEHKYLEDQHLKWQMETGQKTSEYRCPSDRGSSCCCDKDSSCH
ncbi:MAG TPA: hypothetical protein VGL94_06485, partial [Ktedonobacteraceae bacterium]